MQKLMGQVISNTWTENDLSETAAFITWHWCLQRLDAVGWVSKIAPGP